MKTGNKIALFYTAITIGIISMVTVVFYFVATDYISRLYYSYLTEKAYATAQKHWEKDELDEEDYARIQQHYEETLPVAAEILLNADSIAEAHSVLSRYLTDEKIASLYAGNVVRFHEDSNPSGFFASKCRCGSSPSSKSRKTIPKANPPTAGIQPIPPFALASSIAGIKRLHTDAAIITPAAKPRKIL